MSDVKETPKPAAPVVAKAATGPRTYVGPTPPPSIGNLPCNCTKPANTLTRDEQDFVIATVPEAAAWYSA